MARAALLDGREARGLLRFVDRLQRFRPGRRRRRQLRERELDVGHAQPLGSLVPRRLAVVALLHLGVGHLHLRQVARRLEHGVGEPALLPVEPVVLRGERRRRERGVEDAGAHLVGGDLGEQLLLVDRRREALLRQQAAVALARETPVFLEGRQGLDLVEHHRVGGAVAGVAHELAQQRLLHHVVEHELAEALAVDEVLAERRPHAHAQHLQALLVAGAEARLADLLVADLGDDGIAAAGAELLDPEERKRDRDEADDEPHQRSGQAVAQVLKHACIPSKDYGAPAAPRRIPRNWRSGRDSNPRPPA